MLMAGEARTLRLLRMFGQMTKNTRHCRGKCAGVHIQ